MHLQETLILDGVTWAEAGLLQQTVVEAECSGFEVAPGHGRGLGWLLESSSLKPHLKSDPNTLPITREPSVNLLCLNQQ